MSKLFKDYEIRSMGVQLVFSLTFALSCTMFELVIFEIMDVLDGGCASYLPFLLRPLLSLALTRGGSSRLFHWRIDLSVMLALVTGFIPFHMLYLVFLARDKSARLALSFLPY